MLTLRNIILLKGVNTRMLISYSLLLSKKFLIEKNSWPFSTVMFHKEALNCVEQK